LKYTQNPMYTVGQCRMLWIIWFLILTNFRLLKQLLYPSNTACVLMVQNSGTCISVGFQQAIIKLFILSVFCLTTGPKPPPKPCLHIVRSRASSFKWEYPLLSLRSSSSFLHLLPRLLATSISPFIFLYKKIKKRWTFATVLNWHSSLRSQFCYKLLVMSYIKKTISTKPL